MSAPQSPYAQNQGYAQGQYPVTSPQPQYQSNVYPQQGYPQQGYPQQGYPQQGYPQQGQQGMAYPQQQYAQKMPTAPSANAIRVVLILKVITAAAFLALVQLNSQFQGICLFAGFCLDALVAGIAILLLSLVFAIGQRFWVKPASMRVVGTLSCLIFLGFAVVMGWACYSIYQGCSFVYYGQTFDLCSVALPQFYHLSYTSLWAGLSLGCLHAVLWLVYGVMAINGAKAAGFPQNAAMAQVATPM